MQKKIVRLAEILKILQKGELVSSESLAQHFNVNKRTAQRYLRTLQVAGFPLKKNKHGFYSLDKSLLKNDHIYYNESELALILGLKDLLSQLGKPFQKAANDILTGVYANFDSLIFIGIDQSIPINNKIFNQLVRAITNKNLITIEYTVHSPFTVTLEPYKLACFDGFWYLIGKDISSSTIKKYALDKIGKIKILKKYFNRIPEELDNLLKNSANIWFSSQKDIQVKILVDEGCASYFKRKTLFPTQKLEQDNQDGSIIVSFQIGNFEEIIHFLKSWLPWIKILEPEELKEELVEQMKEWIEWQEE
ncbi:helix-turn-helix transcriptional regulator [Desulfovulcanus sp.]